MADTPETPTPEVETPVVAETTPAPAPQYMTQEDFARQNAENRAYFEGLLRQQQEAMQTIISAARRPEPVANQNDVTNWTDEQLQAAADEGRMTTVQVARAIAARENRQFAREHVDPLRAQGGAAISETAKTLAKLSGDMPHFKRFEKEIDEVVKMYGPGAVLTAKHYQDAYRYVLGGHTDEIAAEAREAAIRTAGAPKPEPGVSSGSRARQLPGKNEIPSPADALGEQAARLMDEKGGPDAWCKRMGYAGGWAQYYKDAVAVEA